MKRFTPILIFLLLLGTYACNKKCHTIDELPHEFLSYWYFDQGSWWVYQLKDTTNVFDTVMIENIDVHTTIPKTNRSDDGSENGCTEYIKMITKHSNNLFLNYLENGLYEEYNSQTYGNRESYYVDFEYFKNYLGITFFYYIKNKGFTCDFGACYDIQEIQTPQYTFNETIHYFPFDSLQFYFAKNVGLVKRITNDGKTWELINYSVIQNY